MQWKGGMQMEGWSDDDDFVSAVKPSGLHQECRESRLRAYKKKAAADQKKCASKDPKVQTSFNIGAVVRIVSKFNDEKRKLVESMGFGGLLCLEPLNMFPRVLVLWLIRNMDTKSGTITLPSGEKLTVSEIDVHLALGIPHGDRGVMCGQPLGPSDCSKLRSVLSCECGMEIGLREVESVLDRDCGDKMTNEQTRAFKIALLLYIDAYFLAPKGNTVKINSEIFRSIADTENIHTLDWSGYVLRLLLQSAKRVQRSLNSENRTATLDGCLLFWVIFYLDNVDFGFSNSKHNVLPRLINYSCETVKKLCRMDKDVKSMDGVLNFGINKLRSAKLVVYSRNKDSAHMMSRATKTYKDSGSSGSKDIIQGAVDELLHWLDRVTKETQYTKLRLMESMRRQTLDEIQMKEPLSLATKKTRGSKLKKRIAYRTRQRSSTRERNRKQQVLVEVSSDSSHTDGVLTTNEESFNEMVEMHAKTKGKGACEGAESSEVCNYLTGAGDSADSDESYRETVTETGRADRSGREGNYKLPKPKGSSKHETGGKTPGDVTCYYGAPPVSQTGKRLLDDMELCNSPIARLNVEGRQMIEYTSDGGRAYRNYDSSGQSSCVDLQTAQLETDQGSQHKAHGEDENNMYEFCPTPISVRKNTHTEIVELGRRNTMFINDIEVDITDIADVTRFGISPFVINMTHKDSALKNIFSLQKAMKEVSDEERDMLWYIHDEPSTLHISGSIIHRVVTMNNDFTIDIIDGLVGMYQQMDDEMYKNWSEKRWRHYLPTAFAVSTLNSDIGIESIMAEKLFLGDHISYNVGDCRLVIATLMVDWSWCSYAWDFKRRIISVLDPFSMTEGDAFLEKKHHATVRKMHESMKYCKKHLFPFPEEKMDDWNIENIQVKGGGCDSDDSGLYTMFYARYFDGEVVTRILTKETSKGQKANMICQLLGSKENKAQPPECVQDALSGRTEEKHLKMLLMPS